MSLRVEAVQTAPKVTIGMPIYNGGAMFRDCLENLQSQSYKNFKVLIFDNVSTDETPAIARDFALKDSRIEYRLNSENVGSWKNFGALLDAAESEYFIWRAYDDYTDANFLEELVTLLDKNPGSDLAVGRVTSLRTGRKQSTRHTAAPSRPRCGLWASYRAVHGAHASWFYGLWRTQAIKSAWTEVMRFYPHSWGGDFMMMFDTLFRGRVVGSNKTCFYQRIIERDYKSQDDYLSNRISTLTSYREDAERYFDEKRRQLAGGWAERQMFDHLAHWYVDRRVYSARKLRRMKAKAVSAA
jgi:glycosyltransferase involved in cell wall biosynthesis